ncbi:MAG: hypothetical protein INQ03_17230 [Candidatus Heimdallarchaeota archaeon]|nr:hypothetical protein [Candidatus Heimdallarchaeota archaeon]
MYSQEFLHFDLQSKKTKKITLDENECRKYIGGRGTGVYLFSKLVDWKTEAFSPENALVFTIGPLVGTRLPTATRTSLVTKSPLTNTITNSNAGGRFAVTIRKMGLDGFIITGALDQLSYLHFDGTQFAVHSASELKGLNISETEDWINSKYNRSESLVIGPAGENLVKFASITHNKENDFSRGGVGAVMGSKKLKAIVFQAKTRVTYNIHDKETLKLLEEDYTASIKTTDIFEKYTCTGTNHFPEYYKDIDGITVNNFTVNSSEDKDPQYEMLHGKNMGMYHVKTKACYSCVVKCRHHYEIDNEKILTPEFESVQLLGPHIGIFDPTIILPVVQHATEVGIDTISSGHVISTLQHLIEQNVIDRQQLNDKEVLKQLLDEIAANETALSKEMGEGEYQFAKAYNVAEIVAQVKGMGISAYEPRAVIGQSIGYGISSRGGDHLKGSPVISVEAMGLIVPLKNYLYSGKGRLIEFGTTTVALIDSIGTCIHGFDSYIKAHKMVSLLPESLVSYFAAILPSLGFKFVSNKPMQKALQAITGIEFSTKDMQSAARRILSLERMYNNAQGFEKKDDFLPEKFYSLPKGSTKPIDKKKYTRELLIYYKLMGWDSQGKLLQKTIEQLELTEF